VIGTPWKPGVKLGDLVVYDFDFLIMGRLKAVQVCRAVRGKFGGCAPFVKLLK
jgi:hypothetical protein